MARVDRIEFVEFSWPVQDMAIDGNRNAHYCRGSRIERKGYVLTIQADDGSVGQYAQPHGDGMTYAGAVNLAPLLLGRDPDERERHFDDVKRMTRKIGGWGWSPIDIALWDMAGKSAGKSVTKLLGGWRTRLPTYASSFHGDHNGGLDSKEAFGEFAVACREMGFRAFKIHGWSDGDRQMEADNVLHVRKAVGDRMDLMLDPACELKTFADALYVGRACDEAKFFWYEDPFRDGGYSRFAHRKLRQMISTPILMGEHLRSVEAKADSITDEATDFVRVNPMLDMGITGAVKVAHMAEACGLDVEVHSVGPAHRACMAAFRNTNYYELALVAPHGVGNPQAAIYSCGYSDRLEDVGKDGCYPVPTGPGLGVSYDWDWIKAHETGRRVIK